jgi:hypothetical protein
MPVASRFVGRSSAAELLAGRDAGPEPTTSDASASVASVSYENADVEVPSHPEAALDRAAVAVPDAGLLTPGVAATIARLRVQRVRLASIPARLRSLIACQTADATAPAGLPPRTPSPPAPAAGVLTKTSELTDAPDPRDPQLPRFRAAVLAAKEAVLAAMGTAGRTGARLPVRAGVGGASTETESAGEAVYTPEEALAALARDAPAEDADAGDDDAIPEALWPAARDGSARRVCPACRACVRADPAPAELGIFLHALRYETSVGAWETEMPAWAADAWGAW